jgi:hypothetical protein
MNQNEEKLRRVTVKVDEESYLWMQNEAKLKNWAFDYVGFILLQQAISERERQRTKKKRAKEVHT